MGLLDRLVSGVNRAAEPVQDALTPEDPTLKAADRRARAGEPAQGTIVGVRRVLDESVSMDVLAVAVDTPSGVQRFGIQVSGPALRSRIRLGLVVPVRVEKNKAALDIEALGAAWDLDPSSMVQRSKRGAPDDGVEDKALDARVQKRLKRWPRTTGTITGLERKQVLGMTSMNWDVHLTLADGTTALCPKDEVPFYAWWHTTPGWTVPVAVEPDGKGRAAVDWPAAAVAVAAPGGITDRVPPGSVAEAVLAPQPSAPVAGTGMAPPPPPPTDPGAPVELPFAFQQFLGAAADGAMSRQEVEAAIAEYEAGGLCTPAQAAAARQALG
jgi:hypothetical protein